MYSVQSDGGFCLPCMLFGVGREGVDLGVLVSRPLTNFKKALDERKAHDTRSTHNEANIKTEHFLRVMQGHQEPVEDFVEFSECDTGITGQAVAERILQLLNSYNLDPTLLRGQGYDGAGNMAGKTRGCAAVITGQYPLALYLHCASHQLNLAVVKSAQVTSVRNMMGTSKKLHDFFHAHPKRQQQLETAIEETQPDARKKKIGTCHAPDGFSALRR